MQIETKLVVTSDYSKWAALWQKYLEFYGSTRPDDVYRETWSRIIDPSQKMHSALAFGDGRAVGLVNFLYHSTFWDIEDRCYLNDLYVDPDIRGSGIGAKLIALARTHANSQGVGHLYWLTAQDNAPARRLYDKVATKTPFIKYACP